MADVAEDDVEEEVCEEREGVNALVEGVHEAVFCGWDIRLECGAGQVAGPRVG